MHRLGLEMIHYTYIVPVVIHEMCIINEKIAVTEDYCICNSKCNVLCLDIDECTENLDNCEEGCTNTIGGFTCECGGDKVLNADGRSCSSKYYAFNFTSNIITY